MFGDGVPAFYFQLIVGIYVVEIVYVMTVLVNGIESGSDKLSENYLKGSTHVKSTLIYSLITIAVIVLFNVLASTILPSLNIIPG
jgi:hypothetical protein